MKVNGRQIDNTQRRIDKHLLLTLATGDTPESGFFHPDRKMSTILSSDLVAYVAHRLAQKAAPASCNLELAIVRRAFRLAIRGGTLISMPYIPMMKLNNTRKGFFRAPRIRRSAHAPARVPARAADVRVSHGLATALGGVATDDRTGRCAGRRRPTRTGSGQKPRGADLLSHDGTDQAPQGATGLHRGLQGPRDPRAVRISRPDGSLIKDCRKTWKRRPRRRAIRTSSFTTSDGPPSGRWNAAVCRARWRCS